MFAITGASRGIGKGVAEHLLAHGHVVVGCSRGDSELKHDQYQHAIVDVADARSVREWLGASRRRHGRIDGLIASAAIAPRPLPLALTNAETVQAVLRVNVGGTFNACREAVKIMLPQRYGRIVTISSVATGLHSSGTSAYAASKNAVVEMSRVLASELGDTGITCNVVAPSVVETDILDNVGTDAVNDTLSKLTLKRYLTMAEICHVISFLISPGSSGVTGQVIQMGLVG